MTKHKHRNEIGELTTLTDWLNEHGVPVEPSSYLDSELRYAHRQLEDDLREIVDRATELLADVQSEDADDVWNAIGRINSGAGASGPINTRYQRAVASASRMLSLVNGYRSGCASMREG